MKKNKLGFTLIEVILIIGIIGIIIPSLYSIFFSGYKFFDVGVNNINEQQEYRLARNYLTKKLRNVSDINSIEISNKENNMLKINNKQLEEINSEGNNIRTSISFNKLKIKINNKKLDILFVPLDSENEFEFSLLLENYEGDLNNTILNSEDPNLQILYYSFGKSD